MERFVVELNETVADADARIDLYKHFNAQEVEAKNIEATTKNLGGGSAQLFLSPPDLNLKLYTSGAASTQMVAVDAGAAALPQLSWSSSLPRRTP